MTRIVFTAPSLRANEGSNFNVNLLPTSRILNSNPFTVSGYSLLLQTSLRKFAMVYEMKNACLTISIQLHQYDQNETSL
jgi:hypothetical protein